MRLDRLSLQSCQRHTTSRCTSWRKGECLLISSFLANLTSHNSYKFTRLFPLSQYDLPTHNSNVLSFPNVSYATPPASGHNTPSVPGTPRRADSTLSAPQLLSSEPNVMSSDQIQRNPEVDYTGPEWITLLFSDAGILTPEGVSSYLVTMSLRSELT